MSAEAARLFGFHIGDDVTVSAFTLAQFSSPTFSSHIPRPHVRLIMKLVGIGELNSAVVEDDIERSPTYLLYTPAFTRSIAQCCSYGAITDVQVDANRYVTSVEAAIEQAEPRGASFFIHETAVNQVKAERSIKPESIALGVFGAIAALAALLITGQAIGRQLRLDEDELHALRALGAGPAITSTDGLLGVVGAVVAGALLACAVAILMSPLWPIGPVRPLYPSRGFAADWAVLAIGAAALIVSLGIFSAVTAYRRAPHRIAARAHASSRPSVVAARASAAGLPTSAVAGIRLAVESRGDADSVPMRSAIVGAALALIVLITTVTFGASLGTLVTHPALYGWNWDYMLTQDQGGGNILGAQSAKLLDQDRYVAAASGYALDALRIDGQTIPILGGLPHSAISPPILSGHGFDAVDQIVLGPSTMAALHKHVGDTVEASYGNAAPTRLKIVGTATMPAVGATEGSDLSIGTGAIVSYQLIPATTRDAQGSAFNPSANLRSVPPGRRPGRRAPVTPRDRHNVDERSEHARPGDVARGAAAGGDRQLPLDGIDSGPPRAGTRDGSGRRARPHADRIGPKSPTRARAAEDDGLHASTTRSHGRVAVDDCGGHRHRGRGAARHRGRPRAVAAVRRPASRRVAPDRSGAHRRARSPPVRSCSPTSLPPSPAARRRARARPCCSARNRRPGASGLRSADGPRRSAAPAQAGERRVRAAALARGRPPSRLEREHRHRRRRRPSRPRRTGLRPRSPRDGGNVAFDRRRARRRLL